MNQAAEQGAATVPMNTGTRLSYERTYLAHERTQMAWIRTALSLISFGFTISKFFEFLHNERGEVAPILGAQTIGLVMIAMGIVGLTLAIVQHRRALRMMRAQCPGLPPSISTVAGVLLALLGLLALAGALVRN